MPTTPQILSPVGYSSARIATLATTLVKTGKGVLHSIIVNTKGAAATTFTIYDGIDATGTVLAVPDTLTTSGLVIIYDIAFLTGLCIVTATGTAADTTVVYA